MHIGIDASRAATQQRTGTEAYAAFLIRAALPLLVERQHRVTLYFNQPPPEQFFPRLAPVEHKLIPFPRLWTHLRLGLELMMHPPDLFFTPAHVIPLTYRGTAVSTIHDLGYHHFPAAHPRRQLAYLTWSTRHNARRSRLILADSIATKEDLTRFYDTDPAKIEVLYPGIDPTLAPVREAAVITAVCQRYQIPQPYLLYIGTLQPRKNLVRLVEAYAASGVQQPLVLAGRLGWLSRPILEAIAQLPPETAARVIITGYVDEADKAALLSGATALLFPSLYEGFGFPVLEAQLCETAVLTARTSSLPEVAGDAALYVNPESVDELIDGIQQIATDTMLRQSLIAEGLRNVRHFSWQTAAFQLVNLFEALV